MKHILRILVVAFVVNTLLAANGDIPFKQESSGKYVNYVIPANSSVFWAQLSPLTPVGPTTTGAKFFTATTPVSQSILRVNGDGTTTWLDSASLANWLGVTTDGALNAFAADPASNVNWDATKSRRIFATVAAMTGATWANTLTTGETVELLGYYAAGDGGGGTFRIRANAGSETGDNGITFLLNDGRIAERLYSGDVNVRWFGAKGDNTTDDTSRIVACLNYIESLPNGGKVVFDGKFKVTDTLNIDLSKQSIQGIGDAVLNFSTLANDKIAISIGTTTVTYAPGFVPVSDLQINGPGNTQNGTTGIMIGTTSSPYNTGNVAEFNIRNVRVTNFEVGTSHEENAFCYTFYNSYISQCYDGFRTGTALTNSGERICFIGSTIYNCQNYSVNISNGNGSYFFAESSIDYSVKQIRIAAGAVYVSNCHWEFSTYTPPNNEQIYLVDGSNSARLTFNNVHVIATTTGDAYVGYVGSGAILRFVDCHLFNLSATSGKLFDGAGLVTSTNANSFEISNLTGILSSSSNQVADYSFEGSSGPYSYVVATTPITRWTSADITLAIDGTVARTGTKSLKCTKIGGFPGFVIAIPLKNKGVMCGLSAWYKSEAALGTVFVNWGYLGIAGLTTNELPVVLQAQSQDTISFSDTTDWTRVNFGATFSGRQSPCWATHIYLSFSCSAMANSKSFWVDDVEMNEF